MYTFIEAAVLVQVLVLSGGIPVLFLLFYVQRARDMTRKKALKNNSIAGHRLQNGLQRRKSRILSIVQIGQQHQTDMLETLRPYWNSQDVDERYFSLYYSVSCACTPALQEQLCHAILDAPFRNDRKAEMLRALHLPNTMLQDQADLVSGAKRSAIIQSLNGEMLTVNELQRLFQMQEIDPSIRHAAITCLATSSLEQAFSYIQQGAVNDADPTLRERIAFHLAKREGSETRQLLTIMLDDPIEAVRESAMESITAHGAEGALLMRQAANGTVSPKQKLAQRYLSMKGL